MKKPKTLYRYDQNRRLDRHDLFESCAPQLIEHRSHGTLWRCRHGSADVYGYDLRKSAKEEEIHGTRERIAEWQAWLAKLTKT